MMDRDITRQRQPRLLCLAHLRHRGARRQSTDMHACARFFHQLGDCRQRDRFGGCRDRGQAEPRRDFAVVRDAIVGEECILRAQPHRVSEGRCVLQRPIKDQRIRQRCIGMREADAAGVGKLAHLGQFFALKSAGQRAKRIDMRTVQRFRAPFEHLDQARLVEHRVGIGRARKTGYTAGNRGQHFRFERRLVFESRFAQSDREIDEPWNHGESRRIDHPVGMPAVGRASDSGDASGGDEKRLLGIDALCRIDDAAVSDLDLHADPRMPITAIRTAMPNVTWGRITECFPSATGESISTPRFIGPGCMTIASGLASASFSSVRP